MTSLYVHRQGSGEPLVLLHGHALDHRMWTPLWPALMGRFDAIAYDQRGHGRSPDPTGPYSHVDDLINILDEAGFASAHLLAFSAGTLHAVEAALTHPERVRSLALVSPSGFTGVPFQESIRASFRELRAAASERGLEAARAVWARFEWLTHAMGHPAARPLLEQIAQDYSGYHWLNRDAARYLEPPAITRLRELDVPSLVLFGALDTAYNRVLARRLEAEISDATYVEIPGVGHFPNLEAPERFTAEVLGFWKRQ